MEQKHKMVKISVEVRSGTARFRVGVQAPSIQRALSQVGASYPGRICRVEFPIEPEGFFVKKPSGVAGIVGPEQTHQQAA